MQESLGNKSSGLVALLTFGVTSQEDSEAIVDDAILEVLVNVAVHFAFAPCLDDISTYCFSGDSVKNVGHELVSIMRLEWVE